MEPTDKLFLALKAWQDRIEGMLIRSHETPPATYSELFAEMQKKMTLIDQKIDKNFEAFQQLEGKLQPILDAQEGVSVLRKMYNYIPAWAKLWLVGILSWFLSNRVNF